MQQPLTFCSTRSNAGLFSAFCLSEIENVAQNPMMPPLEVAPDFSRQAAYSTVGGTSTLTGTAHRRSIVSNAVKLDISSRIATNRHIKMLKIRFTDKRREPMWVADKSFAIGAAEDSQLVIDDPYVESQHAKIIYANNTYLLHDLGSTSGTYVNDQRITQKTLQNGDRIKVGQVELEVLDPLRPENQQEWCLVACSSWLAGQEFPIRSRSNQDVIKVGRASHCDLIFAGTHLSREHAVLEVKEGCIQVRDLNSANGTFINDVRVSEGVVYSGDQLRLDVYSFRVFGPGARSTPPPRSNDYDEETKIRRKGMAVKGEPVTDIDEGPKRWKTRPTSPGNRVDTPPVKDSFPYRPRLSAPFW